MKIMNADKPAEFLRGCSCIGVPFAGGMCEVAWFGANIINVNDLDRAVMNLAAVVRDRRAELVSTAANGTKCPRERPCSHERPINHPDTEFGARPRNADGTSGSPACNGIWHAWIQVVRGSDRQDRSRFKVARDAGYSKKAADTEIDHSHGQRIGRWHGQDYRITRNLGALCTCLTCRRHMSSGYWNVFGKSPMNAATPG